MGSSFFTWNVLTGGGTQQPLAYVWADTLQHGDPSGDNIKPNASGDSGNRGQSAQFAGVYRRRMLNYADSPSFIPVNSSGFSFTLDPYVKFSIAQSHIGTETTGPSGINTTIQETKWTPFINSGDLDLYIACFYCKQMLLNENTISSFNRSTTTIMFEGFVSTPVQFMKRETNNMQ